jgi:HAE1 family hydrophobic/amphiphilic exporter-1
MTALARLSLRFRTVTLLLVALLLVTGTLAVRSLNQELFPAFDVPYLVVTAGQPGAGPEVVADGVSRPIEQALQSTGGLRHVDSTSLEGLSIVTAQYGYGTDMADRERVIGDRLAAAGALPVGVTPKVARFSPNSFPIYSVAVAGDPAVAERFVDTELRPALAGIAGVAAVDKSGGSTRVVAVVADPVKLAGAKLTPADLAAVLRQANLSVPVGGVAVAGTQLPVQVEGSTTSLAAIRALPLGPGLTTAASVATLGKGTKAGKARPLTVGDVATVSAGDQGAGTTISRTDGQPSIGLDIIKTQSGNTVKVVDKVRAVLLSSNPPDGVVITEVVNQAPQIRDSVSGLARDALLGAIFAILLILLFLRSVRSTFVAGVSIPLSLLVAFLLMRTGHITLNILTLGALSVAAGRVIDDAIVVLENIYRLLEQGMERTEAVVLGTGQMVPAITASTITTVAVFLPLAFVGGIVGAVFVGFALTVTFALLASLLVAVTVVPVLAQSFLRSGPSSRPGRFGRRRERLEGDGDTFLRRIYRRPLVWALRHRLATIGLAFVLFVGSMTAAGHVPTNMFPAGKTQALRVSLAAAPGTSLAATSDKVAALERSIAGLAGIERSTSVVGTSDSALAAFAGGGSGGPNSATLTIELKSGADAKALTRQVEGRIPPAGLAGGVAEVGDSFGSSEMAVTVTGKDFPAVAAGAGQVAQALDTVTHLEHVTSNVAGERPRLQVSVDPVRTAARGLRPEGVSAALRAALNPTPATTTMVDGSERQIVVTVDTAAVGLGSTAGATALAKLPLAPGVVLGDVATVGQASSAVAVSRHDGARSAEVKAVMTSSNTGQVAIDVQKALDKLHLPAGVETSLGGEAEMQKESFSSLLTAMGIAVFLVYLAMVTAFGSLLTPFVILLSLPLAMIGAFPALLITGRELGLPAMIGLLMLIGIVVTNAIVLLEFVERLRKEGRSTYEALVEGGQTRVRPIVMTAAATVFALLPLALGLSEGALLSASLATVVIGGLVSSTLLTLIVIPVVYSLFDGLQRRIRRRLARRSERRITPVLAPAMQPAPAEPAPEPTPEPRPM